jgi:hypothetical protein
MRRDAFGIDHGFIRRHIQMQVLLMDTSEGTEIRPERRARSFTTVAVDFTAAITIIVLGPFAGAVAHGGMGGVAAMITLPLVGVECRAASRDVVSNKVAAGLPVRMVADPPALLARVPRDDADDGRAIVPISPVPYRANAVIQKLVDWEVYHAAMIPHSARWLHMSLIHYSIASAEMETWVG